MSGACKFCGGQALCPDLLLVGEMPGGALYLHRDQTHPGRLLLASGRHVAKATELTAQEFRLLMDSVYRAAQALTQLYAPDKINYLILGDTGTHLHVHIVPKYRNGKDWGRVFLTDEPTPVYLSQAQYQTALAQLRQSLNLG